MKKQGKERLLEMMSRLDSTFKPKLNENIYVDDNAPQFLEYVSHYLPKVTNIAIKDPNSSMRWDGFFMRNVSFKNMDNDNAYFYYETSGVGHDEEGQRAFGEPKSGVFAIPLNIIIDIDNSYADTNGSVLIINADMQDEIEKVDGQSLSGDNQTKLENGIGQSSGGSDLEEDYDFNTDGNNQTEKIEAEKYFNKIYDSYNGDEKQIFQFFLNALYSPSALWGHKISTEFKNEIYRLYKNKFGHDGWKHRG